MLAQGARAIAVSCRSPIHRAIGGWVTSGRVDEAAGRHRPINRAPTGGSVARGACDGGARGGLQLAGFAMLGYALWLD